MRPTGMVAVALCVVLHSVPAAADSVRRAPELSVIGQRTAVTTDSPPDHAVYELRNVSSAPIEVTLVRATVGGGDASYAMPIEHVRIAGRSVARTMTVAPGSTTRITVSFTLPRSLARGHSWDIHLVVATSSEYRSRPARITRAHRHPIYDDKRVARIP